MDAGSFGMIMEVVFTLLTVTGAAAWLGAVPLVQKAVRYAPVAKKIIDVLGANVVAAKNKD